MPSHYLMYVLLAQTTGGNRGTLADTLINVAIWAGVFIVIWLVVMKFVMRKQNALRDRSSRYMDLSEACMPRWESHMNRIESQNGEIIELLRGIDAKLAARND